MNTPSVGTLAVLALTAAASPFSLIAFSLVLATNRGPKNGIAFIAGWITTVMLIGGIGLAVGGSMDVGQGGTPSDATFGIELALGVVLLMMWVRRRLVGPVGLVESVAETEGQPAWQRRIATMRSPGAFVLGGAVQTWPVMLAGVAEITRAGQSTAESALWLFGFACASASGIVILEVLAWRSPGSAAVRLDQIRAYVASRRDTVLSWAMLVGGLWLAGRGILGLIR